MRASLMGRCNGELPSGPWRAAATAAGVTSADAFLCHLGRTIADALQTVNVKSEGARSRLKSTREALIYAVNFRCDELDAQINSAESSKIFALERELCAADAVLDRLRNAHSVAADTMSGIELELLALPTSVVEPSTLDLVVDTSALLAAVAASGCIVAPRGIAPSDLYVERAVPVRCAHAGDTVRLSLVLLGARHTLQSTVELGLSLGAAAAATHMEASLEVPGAVQLPLPVELSADVPGRCVAISIAIPLAAPVGSLVHFRSLTVSGEHVPGQLGAILVEPRGADLSPEHAAQLMAWLPLGRSSRRTSVVWKEVYRATTHGFGAAAFHAQCDSRARLLVLVQARDGGWLFGGFTSVGFNPKAPDLHGRCGFIADPDAFLFSLTNAIGRPEKLQSMRSGKDLYYHPLAAAAFGGDSGGFDLFICGNANSVSNSCSASGNAFAESSATGAHPMSQGRQEGWCAVEVVAWVV